MDEKIKKLDISVKKAVVNGSMYDIISEDEFEKNSKVYPNNSSVAVEKELDNGRVIDLPIRNINYFNQGTITPGIYTGPNSPFVFTILPNQENINNFTPRKTVEINNHDSMKTILEKEETISRMAEPWITSPDNISRFVISEDDQPEMVALKQALNSKQIDLDKYAMRFGQNFPNDKRQLRTHSATLNIIKRFCDNLDMDAILILKDKHPSVPNPMGREIEVNLTSPKTYEE